jgi:periplasmic protein CpxP/Spy
MSRSIKPAILGLAAAALLSAGALAMPAASALAQTAAPHKHSKHASAATAEERAEAYITDLKAKLQITDAQEQQWDAVAAVIRDNAKQAEERYNARQTAPADQTAVDDLKNYAEITAAHADGVKRLEAAFETLYSGLSDDQKKNADKVFAEREGRGEHHHGKKQS